MYFKFKNIHKNKNYQRVIKCEKVNLRVSNKIIEMGLIRILMNFWK